MLYASDARRRGSILSAQPLARAPTEPRRRWHATQMVVRPCHCSSLIVGNRNYTFAVKAAGCDGPPAVHRQGLGLGGQGQPVAAENLRLGLGYVQVTPAPGPRAQVDSSELRIGAGHGTGNPYSEP